MNKYENKFNFVVILFSNVEIGWGTGQESIQSYLRRDREIRWIISQVGWKIVVF